MTLFPVGFFPSGGQISAKCGNLVVHIYDSGLLPKHYPGVSGFYFQSPEGRASASARMENSECASCPISQFKLECKYIYIYIYIYIPHQI